MNSLMDDILSKKGDDYSFQINDIIRYVYRKTRREMFGRLKIRSFRYMNRRIFKDLSRIFIAEYVEPYLSIAKMVQIGTTWMVKVGSNKEINPNEYIDYIYSKYTFEHIREGVSYVFENKISSCDILNLSSYVLKDVRKVCKSYMAYLSLPIVFENLDGC